MAQRPHFLGASRAWQGSIGSLQAKDAPMPLLCDGNKIPVCNQIPDLLYCYTNATLPLFSRTVQRQNLPNILGVGSGRIAYCIPKPGQISADGCIHSILKILSCAAEGRGSRRAERLRYLQYWISCI
jgi:hypothetical protein